MAEFAEIPERIARYRSTYLLTQFLLGTFVWAFAILLWLAFRDAVSLVLIFVVPMRLLIVLLTVRRDLRPFDDLLRTVKVLNARKKRRPLFLLRTKDVSQR